jgi:very-short-patch-repair endonuclease
MNAVRDAAHNAVRSFASRCGGVVRTRVLIAGGFSRGRIDRAVIAGTLVRVRSGWVCLPDADPQLVGAARAGVVLSCVTQARRLGLADPVENVRAIVAACQPFDTALAVWESALNKGLADRHALRRLDLPTAARRILERAEPYADSGLETLVIPRLRWLRLPLRRQIWIAGHRVDLLIGERLVLQIDGGHHVGAQRESDIAHDAALMLMGYHVIRVGYRQVVDQWHDVQDLIMRAVAQGLHRTRD